MKYLSFKINLPKRIVICFAAFFFTSLAYSQGNPVNGKTLFNSNCAACHKLDKKMTGPPLAGVADKYEREWLYKWIKNSAKLIKSGDADAVKIFEEYNKMPMTAFPQLSNQDIDDILAYTSAPPPKLAVSNQSSGSKNDAEVGKGVSNTLILSLIGLLFLIMIFVLIEVNKKLCRISEVMDLEVSETEKPKSLWKSYKSNHFLVLTSVIIGFLILMYFTYGYLMQIGIDQGYEPLQPIHFSHKIHAGDNKIDCKYCHSSARVSKSSGVPSLNVCMNCHKNISEYNGEVDISEGHTKEFYDKEIQKLYSAVGWDVDNNKYTGITESVKWIRIHNLPDFVYFNHSQHVEVAGVECQKCHGPVETMEVLEQYAPLTMGWCINCHKETNVKVKTNPYYKKIHKALSEKYGVNQLTEAQMGGMECGKCHY